MKNSKPNPEWPRKYLSWSQYLCWTTSGETHYEYFRRYLFNEPLPTTPAMQLGSRMAEMLEHREIATGDMVLEHYRTFLPRYEYREKELRVDYGEVPLLAKPDGYNEILDVNAMKITGIDLGEYKTGKSWTQERADKHEQIDFYALVFWKLYGVIPDCCVHWIPTYHEPGTGRVLPTGEMMDFHTIRTESQLIKFGAKLMMVWAEIGDRYAAEKAAVTPQ